MAASKKSNVLSLSRVYDAPLQAVWNAWTNPEEVAQWWGPRGYDNPVCDMDVRPGGRYRIVMRSPEGAEYPIVGEFVEIVKPSRIVMTMDASEHPKEFFDQLDAARPPSEKGRGFRPLTTVLFDEHFGKTTVTVIQTFETPADVDANRKLGAEEGWGQSFEKLDAELVRGSAA